jgi:hypothetical protein
MPSCEKCWSDAYLLSRATGENQADVYERLVEKRQSDPCSPRQQAGQWWNEERQMDSRNLFSNVSTPKE